MSQPTLRRLQRPARPRGWNAAVAASAAVLALTGAALLIGWLASRSARTSTYTVTAALSRVELDLRAGSVEILGGGPAGVEVERMDDSSFGHSPRERRSVAGGVLRIASRCPPIDLGSCSASYRLTVPEEVAVDVRTGAGAVRLGGFRGSASIATGSGDVTVDAFCGFDLRARSHAGAIRAVTACAPMSLDLRSDTGRVAALVPPGRYRVDAHSGGGSRRVSGLTASPAAPFAVTAISGSGDVSVEGGL